MTEQEIKQKIEQAKQDEITRNFTTWSAEQRRLKKPDNHALWQQEYDGMRARQRSDNDAARRQYQDGLAAQRAERQKEAEAKLEKDLQPQKEALKRDWLANNPSFNASDFETKAWPLLKGNLVEQRKREALDAEMQAHAS